MMRLLNDDPDIPAETRLPVEWIGRDSIKDLLSPSQNGAKSARFWRKKRSINNLFTIISKPVYRIVFN
ncbi:regulatory protein [Klebsiella pneumoniae]|uniref:Regulatory protein n=1 Tax=Klebsiella pneumoniae TaxID=573 RepID=A0A3S4HMA2_KLEPN|nr:regulatory protein [Klebsiella pneumoniae]